MIGQKQKVAAGIEIVLLFLFLSMTIGCAPSVRYTANRGNSSIGSDTDNNSIQQNEPVQSAQNQSITGSHDQAGTVSVGKTMRSAVASYIGIPYRRGGSDRAGFDCSGFVCAVFKDVYNILLPRSSGEMSKYGNQVHLRNAVSGDLVFFKNHRIGKINHVGIYLENGSFVHASVKHGVRYSSINEAYYAKRFAMLRRILE